MRLMQLLFLVIFTSVLPTITIGQTTIVISDPTVEPPKAELSKSEQDLIDNKVLPGVRKMLVSDGCEETIEIAGRVEGAFTRAGSKQTLVFYQFCQTGNGLGSIGVAILENGKVAASFVSAESGWADHAAVLPDINAERDRRVRSILLRRNASGCRRDRR